MSSAQALKVRVVPSVGRRMRPEDVVLHVVVASGVPASEIRGTGRMPKVLAARWAMAYLLRKLAGLSWPEVAELCRPKGTGHSSVILAPAVIELARREASGQAAGHGEPEGNERNRAARREALGIVERVEEALRGVMAGGAA